MASHILSVVFVDWDDLCVIVTFSSATGYVRLLDRHGVRILEYRKASMLRWSTSGEGPGCGRLTHAGAVGYGGRFVVCRLQYATTSVDEPIADLVDCESCLRGQSVLFVLRRVRVIRVIV